MTPLTSRTSTEVAEAADTAATSLRWPIGCLNRPWTRWSHEEALTQIKAAGYKTTGLLSRTKNDPFIGAEATPEYLEALKRRIAASGLAVNMAALRSRHNVPLEDSVRELRAQIDNARFLSIQTVMTFGADNAAEFAHFAQAMHEAADYGQQQGVRLVMKPHGGISGSSQEILRVISEVGHPNFSIWYDAGNIIYYTGKDPLAEIDPIVGHITGFCAKDCGGLKSDVMIQFGTGQVDFIAVFQKLKAAGFTGPVMVECCKVGQTPDETTVNARANREFLEKVLARV